MKLHFATQLYRGADPREFERLLEVLAANLSLPFVHRATIFLDGCEAPWQREGVQFLPLNRRAAYADFLELMADTASSQTPETTHLLFANSDIRFDASMGQAAQATVSRTREVICLTRRELHGDFPEGIEPLQSQDAWLLVQQPLPPLLLDQLRGIRLGVAGCEHIFAAALLAHGYNLWNPCEDCRAVHVDPQPTSYRPDSERYWGLYVYVPPCRLEDIGCNDPGVFFAYCRAPGRYFRVEIG